MKTYDIYAKQNGKWQRKGIQGDPTLPEYDGTVVIEKAERLPYENGVIKAGNYVVVDSPSNIFLSEDFVDESIYFNFETPNISNKSQTYMHFFAEEPMFEISYTDELVFGRGEIGEEWLVSGAKNISILTDQTITTDYGEDDPEYDTKLKELFGTWFNANVKAVSV
jgi:hypothetical protein